MRNELHQTKVLMDLRRSRIARLFMCFVLLLSQAGWAAGMGLLKLPAASPEQSQIVKIHGGTSGYVYDTKDRLTSDSSPDKINTSTGYSESFGYDGAGNPTNWKSNSQSFNSDNQLNASGYAFDGNGNATTYSGATLTYDPENRLTQVGTSSSTTVVSWRADGLKAREWYIGTSGATPPSGASGTFYFYDGGNAVLETNSSGSISAVNVHAPDGLVARKEGSTWKYYQFDQQGNVVNRSNSSGAQLSTACYNAYGKNFTAPNAPDTFRYNARWGYRHDAELGMYLCQHRFYDAGQGRWLNRDPIGTAGGVNLYGYCLCGPVGRADSNGEFMTIGFEGDLGAGVGVSGGAGFYFDSDKGDFGFYTEGGGSVTIGEGAGVMLTIGGERGSPTDGWDCSCSAFGGVGGIGSVSLEGTPPFMGGDGIHGGGIGIGLGEGLGLAINPKYESYYSIPKMCGDVGLYINNGSQAIYNEIHQKWPTPESWYDWLK